MSRRSQDDTREARLALLEGSLELLASERNLATKSEAVNALAADILGVTPRTLWRWLASDGSPINDEAVLRLRTALLRGSDAGDAGVEGSAAGDASAATLQGGSQT